MKKLIVPVILFVAVLTSCGPKKDPNLTYFDEANEYNDYIIDEQSTVFNAYDALISSMEYGSAAEINGAFDDLKKASTEATEKMNKLAPFKKNTDFRDKAKELYSFYANACDKELKELVGIFTKDSDITDADIARVDELSKFMDDGEAKLNGALIDSQKEFAKKFNLVLY
jgi:hypothetical protein